MGSCVERDEFSDRWGPQSVVDGRLAHGFAPLNRSAAVVAGCLASLLLMCRCLDVGRSVQQSPLSAFEVEDSIRLRVVA